MIIPVDFIEIAISLILVWAAIPATIPFWIKLLLTIFFILDSCSAVPIITFYTVKPTDSIDDEGDNEDGKDENNND